MRMGVGWWGVGGSQGQRDALLPFLNWTPRPQSREAAVGRRSYPRSRRGLPPRVQSPAPASALPPPGAFPQSPAFAATAASTRSSLPRAPAAAWDGVGMGAPELPTVRGAARRAEQQGVSRGPPHPPDQAPVHHGIGQRPHGRPRAAQPLHLLLPELLGPGLRRRLPGGLPRLRRPSQHLAGAVPRRGRLKVSAVSCPDTKRKNPVARDLASGPLRLPKPHGARGLSFPISQMGTKVERARKEGTLRARARAQQGQGLLCLPPMAAGLPGDPVATGSSHTPAGAAASREELGSRPRQEPRFPGPGTLQRPAEGRAGTPSGLLSCTSTPRTGVCRVPPPAPMTGTPAPAPAVAGPQFSLRTLTRPPHPTRLPAHLRMREQVTPGDPFRLAPCTARLAEL